MTVSSDKKAPALRQMLFICLLLAIVPMEAWGESNLLVKFRLDADPRPLVLKLEDQAGIKDVDFDAQEEYFPVPASIPEIGKPPSDFTVIIPWKESVHAVYFSVKSTREGDEFDITCKLKQLPPKASSVRKLEQMTSSLKEKLERYLWARDLFRRSEIRLRERHVVTIGALRQWFEASLKLAETEYDLFGIDEEAKLAMLKYGEDVGDTSIFRAVNRPGYAEGMIEQAELLEWQGVAKVRELSKQGRVSDAYNLNEWYIQLWAGHDAEMRSKVTRYYGVTGDLLEQNRTYLSARTVN